MAQRDTLTWNQSTTFEGATVTFVGSAPVHFGGGMPPDGSALFDVARDGETERVTLVGDSDFARAHEALGVALRVVSAYTTEVIREIAIELDVPRDEDDEGEA